jgi:CBS domain-containing protein/anti-sigma regulatory factor (Ser/Thr protein kinase)
MTMKDRQIRLFHELMYQIRVKDAMTRTVDIFSSNDTFRSIQRQMKDKRYSGVPIVDNGQLVGLVTIDDIVSAFDYGYIDEKVAGKMTHNPATVPQNYSVIAASNIFKKHRYGRLPVVAEPESKELVGIITYSDILSYLLMRVNEIAEEFETLELQRTSGAQRGHDKLHFDLEHDNFDLAGLASTNVKKRLKSYGIDPKIIRRIAVICYEAEINVIIHSLGGVMELQIFPDQVKIAVVDKGPGIPDVDKALEPGFTTASEKIRALGFGAGLGLPNMRNYADEFCIKSSMTTGTEVNAVVYIPAKE